MATMLLELLEGLARGNHLRIFLKGFPIATHIKGNGI